MQRCLLVALMLGAACTDWRSLYGQRAQDAGDDSSFIAQPDPDDGGEPAVRLDGSPLDGLAPLDGGGTPEVSPCALAGPVVAWRFDGQGVPSATDFIPDLACRAPDMPLGWDLERNSRDTRMAGGALYLDGGFLFADRPVSDQLGQSLMHAGSFSIVLWLRALRSESGTIFETSGLRESGRAFSIAQKDATLHFAVRTTATDPMGERFAPADTSAEIVVPLPVGTGEPVQVVALYSRAQRAATVFVGGARLGSVAHARPGAPEPLPVWTTGKNQVGLGGGFDGTAWHGWLHQVALYDRALSDAEVEQLFAAGPARATW